MDYIQEELLRQRKALAALMVGHRSKDTEPDDPTEKEHEGGKRKNSVWQKNRKMTVAGEGGVDWLPDPMRYAGVAASAEENSGVLVVNGSVSSVSLRDAQELSRAIQRDARRYDGGFSLY